MDQSDVRVVLRPIGSPLTVAMCGLAIGSLVQSGLDLRWISVSQTKQVGLILLAAPFVLQLLGSVFAYLARDGTAGATMGVLAVSWAGIGLVDLVSVPGARSGALGLLLLGAGAALFLSALAVGVDKPLLGVVFGVAAVRFMIAGIYESGGSPVWRHVAGVIGLVMVALAAYSLLAFELEGQRRRPVLPTFRRGRAAIPVGDGLVRQLDGIPHETGVRQTT